MVSGTSSNPSPYIPDQTLAAAPNLPVADTSTVPSIQGAMMGYAVPQSEKKMAHHVRSYFEKGGTQASQRRDADEALESGATEHLAKRSRMTADISIASLISQEVTTPESAQGSSQLGNIPRKESVTWAIYQGKIFSRKSMRCWIYSNSSRPIRQIQPIR